MPDPRQTLGQQGEDFVADRLQETGYTIRDRNWRHSTYGEIDIVAQHGALIVFIEVRTRRGPAQRALDQALASIDAAKQARLIRLAQAYLATHDLTETEWHITLAAVGYDRGLFSLEVVKDAIEW